jgi:hypothetical protein
MRRSASNQNSTISLLAAVSITTVSAILFGATLEVIATMLGLGALTITVEYALRSMLWPPQ